MSWRFIKQTRGSYLWVGFAGTRAAEYLQSMGLSGVHPIFACNRDTELYEIVRDMMEQSPSAYRKTAHKETNPTQLAEVEKLISQLIGEASI